MRTMILSMLAAALMLAAGSVSTAGMMSSHDLTAIDSSNLAVVSIQPASSPIVTSSHDAVRLDSNGLWLASDYSKASSGHEMASTGTNMEKSGNLYCFDFTSRFCAVAY